MSYLSEQNKSGLKVGDLVLVTRRARDYEKGWKTIWAGAEGMDHMVGKTGTILVEDEDYGFILKSPSGRWYFPHFVLEKVGKKKDAAPKPKRTRAGLRVPAYLVMFPWAGRTAVARVFTYGRQGGWSKESAKQSAMTAMGELSETINAWIERGWVTVR